VAADLKYGLIWSFAVFPAGDIGLHGNIFQSGKPGLVGIPRLACVSSWLVAFYIETAIIYKKSVTPSESVIAKHSAVTDNAR
jgi:hypothetical protein